jgi:cob(I)alamin adenosyltransferase
MTRTGIGIRTAQDRSERIVGQIHIYNGSGKGKSQAALGVVLRSIGLGIGSVFQTRVLLLRFLKGPARTYDEDAAIEALQRAFPHLIDQVRTGRAEFFGADEVTRFDRLEAQRGWDIAKGAIASGLYSVIVLDELNPVLDLGLLPIEEVAQAIKNKPEHLEVIATGRGSPQPLIEIADLHSEMKSHPSGDNPYGIEGIEIYTGAGKGKSTSALGRALQAIGRGISQDKSHRVLVMQWLKGGSVWRGQQQELDYVEAERGWEIARAAIASGLYKTIILDELNPTVDLELLPEEPIIQAFLRKPRDTEIIITGRCKNNPGYFALASTHSEMICHKHYAEKGIELKRGVDY